MKKHWGIYKSRLNNFFCWNISELELTYFKLAIKMKILLILFLCVIAVTSYHRQKRGLISWNRYGIPCLFRSKLGLTNAPATLITIQSTAQSTIATVITSSETSATLSSTGTATTTSTTAAQS